MLSHTETLDITRNIGARALRSIAEELMVDLMYQLPEEPKPGKYVITKEMVEGKAHERFYLNAVWWQ